MQCGPDRDAGASRVPRQRFRDSKRIRQSRRFGSSKSTSSSHPPRVLPGVLEVVEVLAPRPAAQA